MNHNRPTRKPRQPKPLLIPSHIGRRNNPGSRIRSRTFSNQINRLTTPRRLGIK